MQVLKILEAMVVIKFNLWKNLTRWQLLNQDLTWVQAQGTLSRVFGDFAKWQHKDAKCHSRDLWFSFSL